MPATPKRDCCKVVGDCWLCGVCKNWNSLEHDYCHMCDQDRCGIGYPTDEEIVAVLVGVDDAEGEDW